MIRLAHKHARFATRSVRFGTLTLALLLVFCTLPAWSSSALSQTPSNAPTASNPQYMAFSATASMKTARSGHSATLLKNGKVLVVGGNTSTIAEVYDPTTNTWNNTGDIGETLFYHTATLLQNGKVLVLRARTSILYDPDTNMWASTGDMVLDAPIGHTTTLLKNGNVLLIGGIRKNVALYDPNSNSWSTTGNMNIARGYHSATLLNDGRVLVAGGRGSETSSLTSAELYDPTTGTWSVTGSMLSEGESRSATLLKDGKVLVTGGRKFLNDTAYMLYTTELYNPITGIWSNAGDLLVPHLFNTAILLNNGNVIIVGGDSLWTEFSTVELYDSANKLWKPFGRIKSRWQHTTTLLDNGKVFITGGILGLSNPLETPSSVLGTLTDDTDLPTGTIAINGGALVSTSSEVALSISGQDVSSGVAQISLSNDGQTWQAWQPYTESLEWKLAAGDGQKTVYVRFKDYAGNVSAPVSRSIRLDSAAGSEYGLTINNGALFTNQITVELRLSAPALTPEMMISNDGGFAGATWEPYNSVRSWQITQYGSYVLPRTVYVRFKDASGNVFGPNQDDILLDVNAPTGSVEVLPALKTGEEPTVQLGSETSANYIVFLPLVTDAGACPAAGTVNVNLALSADDDVSGVADMMISNSPSFACAKWEKFSKTKAWKAFGKENAPVYVRFRDNAGNVSSAYNSLSRR